MEEYMKDKGIDLNVKIRRNFIQVLLKYGNVKLHRIY